MLGFKRFETVAVTNREIELADLTVVDERFQLALNDHRENTRANERRCFFALCGRRSTAGQRRAGLGRALCSTVPFSLCG